MGQFVAPTPSYPILVGRGQSEARPLPKVELAA
jgi:hypothetical protein